jgi:type IV pilus assembly protein PilQ
VKGPEADEPLVTKIVQLRYADPTNMVALLKPNLSPRSQVQADPRTSQLLVSVTEKEVERLEDMVKRLDTPTKQVLIEAKIYETGRRPETIKGVDWSGTLKNQKVAMGNNSLPGIPPTQPSTVVVPGGGVVNVPGDPGSIGGILNAPGLLMNASAGSFFNPAMAFLNADGVYATVSFLNNDAETELLSTPRAVTLDNQQATLSVTRAYPIFQITPGSANSPAGSQVQYTNLGTILYVTPRIAADNNISLRVIPEVSNVEEEKDSQVINGTANVANIYAIRRIETQVMIPSGNTLVMGGLMKDERRDKWVKVPVLGDIPVMGFFFRKTAKSNDRNNLLIFITPTIIGETAFHASTAGAEFLNTRPKDSLSGGEPSWWDSGKPYDWTKPKQ